MRSRASRLGLSSMTRMRFVTAVPLSEWPARARRKDGTRARAHARSRKLGGERTPDYSAVGSSTKRTTFAVWGVWTCGWMVCAPDTDIQPYRAGGWSQRGRGMDIRVAPGVMGASRRLQPRLGAGGRKVRRRGPRKRRRVRISVSNRIMPGGVPGSQGGGYGGRNPRYGVTGLRRGGAGGRAFLRGRSGGRAGAARARGGGGRARA